MLIRPLFDSAVLDDSYAYDANTNVTAITDGTTGNGGNRSMSYDGRDRLTVANAPHQWWITATTSYDILDNITSNTVGNRSYNYGYDPTTRRLSQLTKPDNTVAMTLAYDPRGNVTSKGTGQDSYSFDAANRMPGVANKESYSYDGYGRRVKITRLSDNKTSYPVYDMGGALLTEDDQRSGKSTDYVNLNGSLVAKRSAPINTTTWTTTYEHTDALHSPVAESDASGAITRIERYTPYGEPGDSQYVQGPGFTGHVTDALTGLTYAQQRYYDPVIGRFLSADPVEANTDAALNFNRYAYAGNNPYKFTDPDGRNGVTALGGLLYETGQYLSGNGFDSSNLGGALADGYNGQGGGRFAAAFDDATTFIPVGGAEKAAVKVAEEGITVGKVVAKEITKEVEGAVSIAKDSAKGGTYVLKDAEGTVVKTGRTNNLARREGELGRKHPGTSFKVDKRTDSYSAQRGREQDLHDANPSAHAKNGGLDKINGISPTNPRRADYLRDGRNL